MPCTRSCRYVSADTVYTVTASAVPAAFPQSAVASPRLGRPASTRLRCACDVMAEARLWPPRGPGLAEGNLQLKVPGVQSLVDTRTMLPRSVLMRFVLLQAGACGHAPYLMHTARSNRLSCTRTSRSLVVAYQLLIKSSVARGSAGLSAARGRRGVAKPGRSLAASNRRHCRRKP